VATAGVLDDLTGLQLSVSIRGSRPVSPASIANLDESVGRRYHLAGTWQDVPSETKGPCLLFNVPRSPMATNERLRGSIAAVGLRPAELAESVRVDPKTVERWITTGRMPHRIHRATVAQRLGVDEAYLWPELLTDPLTQTASAAELLQLHPTRAAVPNDTWLQLIGSAREAMDFLFYAGTHMFEQYDLVTIVARKAAAGVPCRILIGDQESEAVRLRAEEEGTVGGLEGRIQLHRRYLRAIHATPGVQVRSHGTTLYNSLFRFDRDLLVNTHVYGVPAARSPVLHLRRVPGGRMWDHYMESFEEIWKVAAPEA